MPADDQLSQIVNQILNGENDGNSPSFGSRPVSEGASFSSQVIKRNFNYGDDPSFSGETAVRECELTKTEFEKRNK
ncbi:hypothetical protein ABES02_25280 [Neobacillus pocheonensis]|uniref:hypothetical protein n=1 Tax=Neobacillus pocheonensis TaxID=363869 RepID=UPI003D269267